MKKLTLGLTVVMSFTCIEISGEVKQPIHLSELSPLDVAVEAGRSDKIPSFSELKQQYEKSEETKAKKKKLLIQLKNRLNELSNQVRELSDHNTVLERENSSLRNQIQKLQDNALDSDDRTKALSVKLLNLEQEKEELLQKLFEHQMDIQEVKAVSFELNSLLNQIPTEDEITKDCIELLKDLSDMNNRIDQILKSVESVELSPDKGHQIEEILKELKTMQELVHKKVKFYKNHELKLMDLCNKEKDKLPRRLEQLKTRLTIELKKYPELSNLKLEENLMSSINTIKTFRQNKSADQAEQIKLLENDLHGYVGLKIRESDFHRLEKKTRDFSDNIAKIEVMSVDFIKKNNKLEALKNEALQAIENDKIANDNSVK